MITVTELSGSTTKSGTATAVGIVVVLFSYSIRPFKFKHRVGLGIKRETTNTSVKYSSCIWIESLRKTTKKL